jgi:flavin-dependent dehydrogenase
MHSIPLHYDVIIVGGRPAGATLAARLGRAGLRVLLLERATLPSRPSASSPAIYAKTMQLLDETGAAEADYARNTPRFRRWVTEYRDAFTIVNHVPHAFGRDYGYAIDRARFDEALWRNAARCDTVTARMNFGVTDLVWTGECVTGVRGREPGGPDETFSADLVVGADGRFSLVARKVRARERLRRDDLPTTLYYAYWNHTAPYDAHGPIVYAYGGGDGVGFLLMDSADDSLAVVIEGQSAKMEPRRGQSTEAFYLEQLRNVPRLWRRLEQAECATGVHGMKKVGNFYREPGGPGWALVGDALHQKDPLDGQGIFDAVFTAKVLAQAIVDWKRGRKSWEAVLNGYRHEVHTETFPMYVETLRRVKRDIYTTQPDWMIRTLGRWLLDDAEMKRRIGLLLVRGLTPDEVTPSPALIARALLNGMLGRPSGPAQSRSAYPI